MTYENHLRWGFLGTARINQAVMNPIRTSKKSRLTSVASRDITIAEQYAKINNIPRYFATYESLLDDQEIDVIYNSLPNSLHAGWSIKAMQAGKHVLCEKPLTTSSKDIDRLIKVAQQTGRVIAEAFMYRHHPQTIFIKKLVVGGEIGKIQSVRGTFCYTNTRQNNPRFDPSLGGGSLWDVGCYPIGYARYIIGEDPIEAFGHQLIGPTGIDLFFAGQLLFPSGVISQFECSFISPHQAMIEITGEHGRITIPEPYKPGLKTTIVLEHNQQTRNISIKGADLYSGEIKDIENAILSGTPTLISLKDSKANIATIEALYKSANIHRPIKIANQKTNQPGVII